jgi:hypothetical protein
MMMMKMMSKIMILMNVYNLSIRKMSWRIIEIFLVWSSSWIRTLFFNPTRPDEQDPKPSPRVRAPEQTQGSGLNRTWSLRPIRRTELSVLFNSSDRVVCPAQFVGQNLMANPRIGRPTRAFCTSRNSGWALDGQIGLFDSTRRSLNWVRFNSSGHSTVFDPTRRTRTRIRSTRLDRRSAPSPTRRAKGICPTLPKPRVGRPSSGSTRSDRHSRYLSWNLICWHWRIMNLSQW